MSSKGEAILEKLKGGWWTVPNLLLETGWKPATLRGALSTLARKRGLKLERVRDNGITSYRIAP